MKHYGFIYDMQRCLGCRACQLACKEEHKLPPSVYFRRVKDCVSADGYSFFYSGGCNHCKEPACVKICPVGAMYTDEDGLVRHNDALCMGCERCVLACPYGAVTIHPQTGLAAKCDACTSRRESGRPPACVEVCPTEALRFEYMEDIHDEPSGSYLYGGPTILPDPNETLPSLMTINAPGTLRRDPSAAETRYYEDSIHTEGCAEKELSAPGSCSREESIRSDSLKYSGTDVTDILIIGGGIAGASAALAAAEADRNLSIKICGDEEAPVYGRPMLSKCLLKGFRFGRYQSFTAEELKKYNIDYNGGRNAVKIDADAHLARFSDGSTEAYRRCIIAAGAEPAVPPIPGTEDCDYMTLRKARDTELLRKKTLKAHSAVMIGGGFIGLEIAWQLKELGLDVTLLEAAPSLLGRLVDRSTSDILVKVLNSKGLHVYTEVKIKRLNRTKSGTAVCLSDGTEFPADLVIISTGVRANTELAKASGAACGRGVRIDGNCRTSLADVFACGDCAETEDGIAKQNWANSVVSGRNAGLAAVYDLLQEIQGPEPCAANEKDAHEPDRFTTGLKKSSLPDASEHAFTDSCLKNNRSNIDSMMVNIGDIHILSAGTVSEQEGIEKLVLSWKDEPSYYQVNETVSPWEKPGNGGERMTEKPNTPACSECKPGNSDTRSGSADNGLFTPDDTHTRAVFFFKEGKLEGLCAVGSLKRLALLEEAAASSPDKEAVLEMLRKGGITA